MQYTNNGKQDILDFTGLMSKHPTPIWVVSEIGSTFLETHYVRICGIAGWCHQFMKKSLLRVVRFLRKYGRAIR